MAFTEGFCEVVLREQKQLTEPAGGEKGAFAPEVAQTLLSRRGVILMGVGGSIEARKPGVFSPMQLCFPYASMMIGVLEGAILMRCY